MRLLRTKVWSWLDIALLKWCCLLLGAVIGAWLAGPVRSHAGLLLLAAVLLGIRPAVHYWGSE